MNQPLRVIVADDHHIFRVGMVATLRTIKKIETIQQAQNGAEALDLVRKDQIDVIFMDIKMPVMNGIEATKIIRKEYPSVKVMAVSMYDDQEFIIDMFIHGACAYLLKNTDHDEITEAIETVLRGEQYYSRDVSESLFKQLLTKNKTPQNEDGTYQISEREKEVLILICKEFSNREMAEHLFISPRTIEGHRNRLLQKTNSKNTAGLVTYAIRHHIWDAI
ncbi:MAG: response regulator transcription factor [Chitinophagales bacterium]|jgi:DNA-binding NarL/FixJ family response regulator|nr:response regulator transcription factor [Chitinophagales bacterium]